MGRAAGKGCQSDATYSKHSANRSSPTTPCTQPQIEARFLSLYSPDSPATEAAGQFWREWITCGGRGQPSKLHKQGHEAMRRMESQAFCSKATACESESSGIRSLSRSRCRSCNCGCRTGSGSCRWRLLCWWWHRGSARSADGTPSVQKIAPPAD